jgi:large subunit ribosomal protein L10
MKASLAGAAATFNALPVQMAQLAEALRAKRAEAEGSAADSGAADSSAADSSAADSSPADTGDAPEPQDTPADEA